jgi:hypothetical protein
MDISDILFNPNANADLKRALMDIVADERITNPHMLVLVPTDSNDDVNRSQHARDGGNDFGYRDATEDDLDGATTLGHYEYFSGYGSGYTGHYYNGDGRHFEAIVLNPPAYAISHHI